MVIPLVAVSTFVALLSVIVPFEQWWRVLTNGEGSPIAQSDAVTLQRQHDFFWSFGGNHIAGNLRLMGSAEPFPFRWWTHDSRPIGLALLVSGVLVLMVTSYLAWLHQDDHAPPDTPSFSAPESAEERDPMTTAVPARTGSLVSPTAT
jgi:hypothetical protein